MKKKLWIFFIGVACLLVLAFIVTLLIDYFVNYEFGSSPFWVYVVLRSLECIIPAIAFFIVGCILKKKLNQE